MATRGGGGWGGEGGLSRKEKLKNLLKQMVRIMVTQNPT